MNNSVEKTGKTVQEAVSLALEELKTNEENVDIEVIDEGNKGIFGLLGNKTARVLVSLKEEPVGEKAGKFLKDIFALMEEDFNIDIQEDNDSVVVNIMGGNGGIIIGRRGETLDALQYLTSLVANKGRQVYKRVTVDIENYRKKREDTLSKLANRLADKVISYRKPVSLEPMSPYERRIIHSTLQDNKYVKTYSMGVEPNRKVVIALK